MYVCVRTPVCVREREIICVCVRERMCVCTRVCACVTLTRQMELEIFKER